MTPAIEIESISKKFLIASNKAMYETFRESISSLSFLRPKHEFWALRDISFSMMPGETMGIIGDNGAGKTTLLKILSRITKPTSGHGMINGRVASLLEVGTGFHPELTGKENIYLNGVILGLRKREIDNNFDRIVDFAGISEFINTPIKHYSTGMWARLAFSVAAHLEPEILLIDEVLSVGDAEFQKRSLAKMNDLSKSGRTVVFVSHNMAAVRNLCNKCLLIGKGQIIKSGSVNEVVNSYMSLHDSHNDGSIDLRFHPGRKGSQEVKLEKIELCNQNDEITSTFKLKDDLSIHLFFNAAEHVSNLMIVIEIIESTGDIIAKIHDSDSGFNLRNVDGHLHISTTIRDIRLYPGRYHISVSLLSRILDNHFDSFDSIEYAASFDLVNHAINRKLLRENGLLLLTPEWRVHGQ